MMTGSHTRSDQDDVSSEEGDAENEGNMYDKEGQARDEDDQGGASGDESVSAKFGSDVDPEDQPTVSSATEEAEEGASGRSPSSKGSVQATRASTRSVTVEPEDELANSVAVEPAVADTEVIVLPQGLRNRQQRYETASEIERNNLGEETKLRRTGLRERRPPARYNDLVKWAIVATRILGRDGRPIGAKNIKIPKSRRQAVRSKFADFWRMAELEEMATLKAKGVLEETERAAMPENGKPIRTMWIYALKTDAQVSLSIRTEK
jgi:hypothetical protein